MSFLNTLHRASINFLHSFDIFGTPLQMQIKRKSEYHTIFGSIISVAIMSFITYSFISLVVDLFERQNPNIISNLVFNKNPSEFILNQKDYFFAVTVADEYGVPIVQKPNQTIYGVDLDLCWRHPDVNGNVSAQCSTFRLQSCLSLNISQDMISVLDVSQQTLKYSFCLDPLIWANTTISLEGTATSQHFKYMFVRILKCNSTVFTEQCASDQIISSTLNRGYIALLMADRLLNQNQIGYPYKTILKSISTTFTVTQYKSLSVILRKSSFQNHENFFYYFGVLNEYETLQQEQQVEQVEYTPRNEIVSALIYLDEKQIIYYRTYDNILNILGSIGGLLELMGLLLGFVIKPLNNLAANLFLANQVFQI